MDDNNNLTNAKCTKNDKMIKKILNDYKKDINAR